jgi:hypothetical protein
VFTMHARGECCGFQNCASCLEEFRSDCLSALRTFSAWDDDALNILTNFLQVR